MLPVNKIGVESEIAEGVGELLSSRRRRRVSGAGGGGGG